MSSFNRMGRWRRTFRRHRRRFVLAVTAVAVCLIATVVVTLRAGSAPEAWHDPWDWADPAGTRPCELNKTRESCLAIPVGGRQIRYALLKAPAPTADTVLIDLGGPGVSVLSGSHGLGQFHSAHPDLRRFNLLFVEEPWVVQELPKGCDTALSGFYRQLRAAGDITGSARTMAAACQISQPPGQTSPGRVAHRPWGFDDNLYAGAVWSITRRHALALQGFIGHSWGSIRLSYLRSGAPTASSGMAPPSWPDLSWTVLIRPMPVNVKAPELIDERAKLTPAPVGRFTDSTVDTRSLPVTRFDQLSAIVALGYVDDAYLAQHAGPIRRGTEPAEIAPLSDGLWHRFGVDSISPAMLAQWQETCAVLGPATTPGVIEVVGDLLAAAFAPCQADLDSARATRLAASRSCVVVSNADTVIPRVLGPPSSTGRSEVVESKVAQHGSLDGLDQCLRAVAAR